MLKTSRLNIILFLLVIMLLCLTGGLFYARQAFGSLPLYQAKLTSTEEADLKKQLENDLIKAGTPIGSPVFIRIFKEEKNLELWTAKPSGEFSLFRVYKIYGMSGGLGPKLKEGDAQAPEGFYAVGQSGLNPWSSYYRSFNLGYPNSYDRHHGRTGNYLMVHGDWRSLGCFAMSDRYMAEIYHVVEKALDKGQPFFRVHCFPFRLNDSSLKRHASSKWAQFWHEMKPFYEYFEYYRIPPDIDVFGGKYVFSKQNQPWPLQ